MNFAGYTYKAKKRPLHDAHQQVICLLLSYTVLFWDRRLSATGRGFVLNHPRIAQRTPFFKMC